MKKSIFESADKSYMIAQTRHRHKSFFGKLRHATDTDNDIFENHRHNADTDRQQTTVSV